MRYQLFKAIIDSSTRELKRMMSRPIYFITTILVMTFCFVFFLTFFDEGQPNKMPIGIVDLDQSSLSRQLVRNIDATQQVSVITKFSSHKEAREEMQRGNIYGFVEIKQNFAKDALTSHRPAIELYVNDAYLIAGSLVGKDLMYMSALSTGAMQRQILRAKGIEESRIMGIIQPIAIDTHLIGNQHANYGVYLLNVLLPGVLQLMILMMTIFAIGIEFKERTSARWLENANNSIFAAVTGKLLPYTLLFFIMGMISNLLLYHYMQYPLHSNIGWMFLNTFLFVVSYQAIGILIIGLMPVLRDGVTIVAFYGLLGFTFAGFTFPIEQMPAMSRIFSYIFPIRHYFNIYVNQALNGLDARNSILSYVALLSFCILPFFVYHRLKSAAIKQNFPIK
ncbi:MAG: ABC transporter permease [Paludibacter sp.]|nr:ABC transporter permease [Paludibacter sp.]